MAIARSVVHFSRGAQRENANVTRDYSDTLLGPHISETKTLEALQGRASPNNPGDREALLKHADAIDTSTRMTKLIVGVAMMMLWQQGKWTLDDPARSTSRSVPTSRWRHRVACRGGTTPLPVHERATFVEAGVICISSAANERNSGNGDSGAGTGQGVQRVGHDQ